MARLYGLAGSHDCAWSGVFVTVRYMVWWNDEGAAGELQFTSGWDAQVDLFAYKIEGYEASKA